MRAINIEWDVDYEEQLEDLPEEMEIPEGMTDEEEISDWLSDETGFCHKGFVLTEDEGSKKVVIKEGVVINLNNEVVTITEVMNNIGFYYKNESDEVKFCNTMFETLNFIPVYE